jgi:4-hydroxythreonine-4-phosphate dehydrogenase
MGRRAREPEPRQAERPVLAVSLGDPGGIGPEVTVRALAESDPGVRFIVFGSGAAMHRAAEVCDIEPYWWRVERGSPLLEAAGPHRVLLVDSDPQIRGERSDRGDADAIRFAPEPTRLGGDLSYRWVCDAIDATRLGEGEPWRADGLVTAPISKEAWHLAGHTRFAGHTELLASRLNARRVAMMFEGPSLRVVLATVHLPLMQIRDVLTIGVVYDAIDLGVAGCRRLGIENPRVAVCGLNPHAGENGVLGDEESRLITPAIRVAREQGIRVEGPFPGDTIFNRATNGEFDLVVAMYHDQGLIPVKLLARDASVNITVGLPIVRTSPDHGTAFDIAGRGIADPGSMKAAVRAAVRMLRPGPVRTPDPA